MAFQHTFNPPLLRAAPLPIPGFQSIAPGFDAYFNSAAEDGNWGAGTDQIIDGRRLLNWSDRGSEPVSVVDLENLYEAMTDGDVSVPLDSFAVETHNVENDIWTVRVLAATDTGDARYARLNDVMMALSRTAEDNADPFIDMSLVRWAQYPVPLLIEYGAGEEWAEPEATTQADLISAALALFFV